MSDVAALYVDARGPYPTIAGVDSWDETRDARKYEGADPVVAHPPCQLWGNFAALNFKRYGGDHNRPGNDGGCFAHALATVRRCGGVLEHPASSKAWEAYGLPLPGEARDAFGGYSIEVAQVEWGHGARKLTWLYLVRVPSIALEAPPFHGRQATHQCGWFDRKKPTLGKREASLTPPAFADYLVRLARAARR